MSGIEYPAGYDRPIASAARHLLNTIIATYETDNTALPERHVITVGSVAVDAPVLAVMYGGLTVGPPGNEQNVPFRGEAPRTIVMNVELWRRTPEIGPGGNAPSAVSVSAAAEIAMHDSWLLVKAAFASDQMGVGIIARTDVRAPQGGMVGVSLLVETTVP